MKKERKKKRKKRKRQKDRRRKKMASFDQSPDFVDLETEEQIEFKDAKDNLRLKFSRDLYYVYVNRRNQNGIVSNFSLNLSHLDDVLIKKDDMKFQCSNTNELIAAIKAKVFTIDEGTSILAEKNPIIPLVKDLNLGFQSNIFNTGGDGGLKPSTTFRLYKSVVVNRNKPSAMAKIYFSSEGINMSTFELSNFLDFLQKIKDSTKTDADASVESD